MSEDVTSKIAKDLNSQGIEESIMAVAQVSPIAYFFISQRQESSHPFLVRGYDSSKNENGVYSKYLACDTLNSAKISLNNLSQKFHMLSMFKR